MKMNQRCVPGPIRPADVLCALTHDMQIAFAVIDAGGRVSEVGGAVDLLGCGADAVGRAITELIPELTGSESAVTEICAGSLGRFELALVNREAPDGAIGYVTVTLLPLYAREGDVGGAIVLLRDLTESGRIGQQLAQHRNELDLARRALEAANVELERASELKSQFVAVAAHELRSPLTTILGYTEMLLDAEFGPLNDEQRGALDSVNQAAHRLLATASDLLDVTRIEAGRIDLQLVPTDLADVVRQVAAELAPQHRAKGQALSVDVAHDLPLALCDATRMEQVLTNLISNASAYTPDSGHLGVEVRLAAEPGYLQVTVSDDGVGIAEDDQVHVFSRFYRAAATRRMSANGLGLGLTIARELVELQGGRIWLESAVGKGTRVTFTLPAV